MILVLTTASSSQDAERLARLAVEAGATCCQIHGPIRSIYPWQGRVEVSEEWHLTIKALEERIDQVRARVLQAHSYEVPQWIECTSSFVAEKYLQWARGER